MKIKEIFFGFFILLSGVLSFLIAKAMTPTNNFFGQSGVNYFSSGFLIKFFIFFVLFSAVFLGIFFKIASNFGGKRNIEESEILSYKEVDKAQRKMRNFFFYTPKSKGYVTDKGALRLTKNIKLASKYANEHTMAIAPTGGGKTSTLVIPMLRDLDNCSAVITDPKGELYLELKEMFRRKGYITAHLSFLPNTPGNVGYNLLEMCETEDQVRELADAIMSSATADKKDEWAKLAMTDVQMWLFRNWRDEDGKKFDPPRTLNDVIEEMTNSPMDLTKLELDYFTDVHPAAVREFKQFAKTAGAESYIASINATVNEKLSVFSMAIMGEVSSKRTFRPEWMRQKKVALFLSYPPNRADLYQPFLSAFFYQFFSILQDDESVDQSIGRNDGLQIHFILDEMANAGVIPSFNKLLTTIRSKKMAVTAFLQSLSQLELVYGKKESDVIVENFKTKIVLPSTTAGTAKFFSDLTGEKIVHNTSISFGDTKGTSTSISQQTRKVLTPDEIRRMDENKALIISANLKPILDDRDYWYLNNFQYWLQFKVFKSLGISESVSKPILNLFKSKKPRL